MTVALRTFPPMPTEYYRRQANRVHRLAHDATTLATRDHLRDVALQYEKLAEGAEAIYPAAERMRGSADSRGR